MRYLEKRPDGSWRYQRAVPARLVKLVGDGKLIKRHIGHMCQRAAEEIAAQFASSDSHLFAHLVALAKGAPDKAAELVAAGGWMKLPTKAQGLEARIALHAPMEEITEL